MNSQTEVKSAICSKCNTNNRLKKTITCAHCGLLFHRSCVGVTRRQAEEVPRFLCSACTTSPSTQLSSQVIANGLSENDFTNYIHSLQTKLRPVLRIPKGARGAFAKGLSSLVSDILQNRTDLCWQRLIVFPLFALSPPTTSTTSLTTALKNQINDFIDTRGLPTIPSAPDSKRGTTSTTSKRDLKRLVNAHLSEYNIKGAVRILSSSASLVAPNQDSLSIMKKKHPPRHPEESCPPAPDHHGYTFGIREVQKALQSFPCGSGSGPDGLRPQHLKDATSFSANDAGVALLGNLTALMNLIAESGVHNSVQATFFGARLIALTKPNGDLRPIAIGCTMRRLCAKMVLVPNSSQTTQHFGSHQVGVGTRLGSEATVHSVRKFIQESEHTRNKIVMKLDLSNAFNSVRRDTMLKAVFEHMPQIYPLAHASYNQNSNLFFDDFVIPSSCGVQQGDPLGPVIFSMAINEVIKNNDLDLNIWYLDDGCIGGEPDQVINHTKHLISKFKEIGLNINTSKCEILKLNNTSDLNLDDLPGIKITNESNWRLLGAPLNSTSTHSFLEEKEDQLGKLLINLDEIEKHQAFFILKNFLFIPKLTYALRSSPLYEHKDLLLRFDDRVRKKTEELCNVQLDDTAWKQASLPLQYGGLGVRNCTDLALPCYLSSLNACAELSARILSSINPLSGTSQDAEKSWLMHKPIEKTSQKAWDRIACNSKLTNLESEANQFTKARLLAPKHPHSADWMLAVPVSSLGTLLSPQQLQIAVALRLGTKVCQSVTCRCGCTIDEYGLHGLSCRLNAGRFPRHVELNHLLKRSLQKINIPSTLEPAGLSRRDGKRPDGITLCPWTRGRSLLWDATVTDTFCSTNISNTCLQAASAAANAENSKRKKYADLTFNYEFEPIAFETSGVWGPTTSKFLDTLKKKMFDVTNDHKDFRDLCQQISLCINRGNCASILSCIRLL